MIRKCIKINMAKTTETVKSDALNRKWEKENLEQFLERIKQALQENPDSFDLQEQYTDTQMDYADELKNQIIRKYDRYDKKNIRKDECVKKYEELIKNIANVDPIHHAMIDIINENKSSLIQNIKKWFEINTIDGMSYRSLYGDFIDSLVKPLKNGMPDMWMDIKKIMESHNIKYGLPQMCEALEIFYHSGDNEKIINALSEVIRTNKQMTLAIELLGYTYYQMDMWENAIACFRTLENISYFSPAYIYFWTAWAYGKIKNLSEEENYYRKSLSVFPNGEYILNKLGYCLYKQKKQKTLNEAKEIFEELIAQGQALSCAPNGLVRVLLAMGKYQEATSFIESYNGTISKNLKERSYKLLEQKGSIDMNKSIEYFESYDDLVDDDEENLVKPIAPNLVEKHEQFTSEKLFEEVLFERMKSGIVDFGLSLSVYHKEDDPFYGKQYRIGNGRKIDILAIDTEDNFYVIELKKDAGYGDACDVYHQTLDYMEWVKENMAINNQNVYGIICLNAPPKKLKEKIKINSQISLFEYKITFSKVR